MCGIGAELELYVTVALFALSTSGMAVATIFYKNDLVNIFKKEEENVSF